MGAKSRVSIHRRSDGGFLTTINTQPIRSWVLNDEGKCTLPLSLNDAKSARHYMGSRNLIHISHESLPAWGGVIDMDEEWGNDIVSFTAWSGESLLRTRTPRIGLISATSPGALFRKIISLANGPEDLRIREGSVYTGGKPAETTLDGTNLLDVIKDIARRRNMDFSIDPALDANNRLYFSANWYESQGTTKTHILKEGFNFERGNIPLRVQRGIVNQLIGIGEASSDDMRPVWTETDDESRGFYGLIQGTENFDGNTSIDTVKANTIERLNQLKQPRRTFDISALDKGDTFANLRKGNILPLQAFTFGWLGDNSIGTKTNVRILGIRYIEKSEQCELTLDEEIE